MLADSVCLRRFVVSKGGCKKFLGFNSLKVGLVLDKWHETLGVLFFLVVYVVLKPKRSLNVRLIHYILYKHSLDGEGMCFYYRYCTLSFWKRLTSHLMKIFKIVDQSSSGYFFYHHQ